jgi:protein ImuB
MPDPCFACLYRPAHAGPGGSGTESTREGYGPGASGAGVGPRASELPSLAADFSPRYQIHRDDLVVIDVSGLERLFLRCPPERESLRSSARHSEAAGAGEGGAPRCPPERESLRSSARNSEAAVASGGGAPRVWKTIGEELRRAAAVRGLGVHVAIARTQTAAMALAHARPGLTIVGPGGEAEALSPLSISILEKCEAHPSDFPLQGFRQWGLRTLGELAALPAADLVARLGKQALAWQTMARGEDRCPLIPALPDERFDALLELEWPIEGLEPLSFVLTRLLEPLSTRLERRDRGAAVLHVMLGLVTKDTHARRLELPTPMRDVRALRTLALLDLESHPPPAAIDTVAIVIDPTPGRVVQHTLFTRAQPTPEQLSTLVARLGALMGQDRLGSPATVDSFRPGAFAMAPYATEQGMCQRRLHPDTREHTGASASAAGPGIASALHRCRHPVPARVAIADGRPVRVTTDRRGFAGGAVVQCAGPWKVSGDWWMGAAGGAAFNRDEWDIALSDGAAYRIFRDRDTDGWFIDGIVD